MKTVYAIGFDKAGNLLVMNRKGKIEPVFCSYGRGFCNSHCVHCGNIHAEFTLGDFIIESVDDAVEKGHNPHYDCPEEFLIDFSCGNETTIKSESIFEQGESGFFFVLDEVNMLKKSFDEWFQCGNKSIFYNALQRIADLEPIEDRSIGYLYSLCEEMRRIALEALNKMHELPYKAEAEAKGTAEK